MRRRGSSSTVLGVDTVSDSKVRDYDITADDVRIEDDLAFLNDPKGVLITTVYAERTGLKIGDVIKLETVAGREATSTCAARWRRAVRPRCSAATCC